MRGDLTVHLNAALADRVAAGAPGALARLEAPRLGLQWAGAKGRSVRGGGAPLEQDAPFRAASVTKTLTAVGLLGLAGEGRLRLDQPLGELLPIGLLGHLSGLGDLPAITPRQLLAHTAGLYDYFHDPTFEARVSANPGRPWEPVELLEHAARHGEPTFPPGEGFRYSDSGYVLAGLTIEHLVGEPLHAVYRAGILGPLGMDATYLEGQEPARDGEPAHHYRGETDLSALTPTIDWAGGGLVTTAPDLARFVRGLWSGRLLSAELRAEMTRWTPGARFPPGIAVRYDDYGLGIGRIAVEGVELIGHTGFWGAFAWYAPEHDAVLVGTHNDATVDRAPLVAAFCRALRTEASVRPP
jgi:D-alanyl-D-alanine carboxypeptidase